ncbi:type IX secretion/gliding motility protein PorT/SprT [Flavobacterium aquicola]|nr:porin family protein [Flavobacterium aquicola]
MKKIIVLILLCTAVEGSSQSKGIFSKDPIINLENWQKKKLYFGFFLGFNTYDFKIDYKTVGPDIQVDKSGGFNVGLVTNFRLQEYLDLRFEPGLYYSDRILHYPPNSGFNSPSDAIREINSTYVNFPLLLKFSALRTGNVRPYLLGGVSANLNLSSNAKSFDDNLEERFRVKTWTTNYEIGFGIDIFSEYFIFSPSIRGQFGISDELIRDKDPNSPWTGNIQSMKSRGFLINFAFH